MTWFVRLAAASLLVAPPIVPADAIEQAQLAFFVPGAHLNSSGAVPHDRELQRRGARIGRIDVKVDEVFEDKTRLAAPYRLANGLHIATQATTVFQQLLFRSGEAYSRRLLEETERLLRGQRYFNDAMIEPVRYNEDNTVDVLVRVHDVWTLSPGFSFGRKGGQNSTKLKFEDTNFLGLGKELSLARASDVDRSGWYFGYLDPNLFGSWWKLAAAYSSLSDGSQSELALERPFYSLDAHWSAGASVSDSTSAVSRYSLGEPVERLDMQRQLHQVSAGWSSGLRDGWTKRYLAGARYDAHRFAPHPDEPTASIPADRVLAYPWLGLEWMQDQYVSTRNLDQIGRTEDLYLGRRARIEAGFASTAVGSTSDALILDGSLQAGADLGGEQYLINTLAVGGRVESGELANARLDLSSRYYRRQSVRRVFFAALSGSVASNLDPEEQLLLGGDSGLRGYPLRYQAGTASALLTLEERFYTRWQPLKLFNVGAAVFFDAGRTWGNDPFAAPPTGWLKDVGLGLRLGSARSGLGNVLHIDLALPLDRDRSIDAVQLLIETRRSF